MIQTTSVLWCECSGRVEMEWHIQWRLSIKAFNGAKIVTNCDRRCLHMLLSVKKLIDTAFDHIGASMSVLEPTKANKWSPTHETHSLIPPLSPEPLTHQPQDDWGTIEPMEFELPECIAYIGVYRPKLHAMLSAFFSLYGLFFNIDTLFWLYADSVKKDIKEVKKIKLQWVYASWYFEVTQWQSFARRLDV